MSLSANRFTWSTGPGSLLVLVGVWLAGTLAGCTFDSGLSKANCENEGASSGGGSARTATGSAGMPPPSTPP